jgi:hypothetical protein
MQQAKLAGDAEDKPSFRLAVTTKRRKSWKNCPGSSKNVAM